MARSLTAGNVLTFVRLANFPTSVHYDRPAIDGDMMGRAYPSMEHGGV